MLHGSRRSRGPAPAGAPHLIAAYPGARALIEAVAAGSPYLGPREADPARLVALCSADPEAHLAALPRRGAGEMTRRRMTPTPCASARSMKAEAALLIALADIGGVWDVMRVTACAHRSRRHRGRRRRALSARARPPRGQALRRRPGQPEAGSGYIVLAMGKMGACELNYSSDIDLIVLFDPAAPALAPRRRAGALVRAAHARARQDAAGAHRRRLRVPRRSAAASRSVLDPDRDLDPAALDYYESRGQNWERAAMIKARACAGDLVAGEAFLRRSSRRSSGANISISSRVADVHAMKRQIHAYRGHGEIAVEGHNIKLGRGGIREIEFFVQTQQLIAGGRHPGLRGRETLRTLDALPKAAGSTPRRATNSRRLRVPAHASSIACR